MSVKDKRYYRKCVICGDALPGTDDGEMVFDCLKEQLVEIDAGATYTPNCTLCGEECELLTARAIIRKGVPKLKLV